MWRIARWFIALSEISGGALMLSFYLYPPFSGQSRDSWPIFLAEGLGVAAIVAGGSLLKNSPSGYRMSLAVQAIQILRVYGGRFIFAVILGPQVLINFVAAPGAIPMGGSLGFAATLYIAFRSPGAASIWAKGLGINVLALVVSAALFVRMANDSE